jgi:F-type H+-transporting ATPase subunit b
MIESTIMLAVEAAKKEGGLFDIGPTLPFMAIQFLFLLFVLNQLFYKPLSKAIDERAEYVRKNKVDAKERLSKAEKLANQYEEELGQTRKQAQTTIATAQAEAQKIAAQKIAEAQQEAQAKRETAAKEIEQQKQEAMQNLEQQIDVLSRQILEKLLGPELVNRR